jgi:flavin reductase (DIM6/NTAB) family NADH-FMN oxidoreductase RutF
VTFASGFAGVISSKKLAMITSASKPELFRRVLGNFATGVTVITVERSSGMIHGMTASSFTSLSLDPLLVLVCVDHEALLLSYLKMQRRFGVSILKAEQRELSDHFARGEQGPEADARLGIRYQWTVTGIPLLENSLARVGCNVVAEHPGGDHTIFVAEVESMEYSEGEPLIHHRGRYRQLQP